MNWDRRSRPDTIMRDSSAAICHRYEREGREGGGPREIEEGGREGGRPSVQKHCHKTAITQAPGPQIRPACEDANNYFYTRQEAVKHGKAMYASVPIQVYLKDILLWRT